LPMPSVLCNPCAAPVQKLKLAHAQRLEWVARRKGG